jgi:cobalt-zinc-cadmium efflux system membrane fusion protein
MAAPADWCVEHGLPESKCTKCNPKLVAKFIEAGDYCREHGYPESACPICHPDLVRAAGREPPRFPAPGTIVRLESADTANDVGIETARVESRPFAQALEVVGQLAFNENRHAELSPRGEALVVEVKVDIGDSVRAGESLVILSSSSVGSEHARLAAAQARLETARSAFERQERLAQKGVIPRKDAEEAARELAAAQADQDAARSALEAAGASTTGSGGRYALAAPFGGTVVRRDAVRGKTAVADQVLIEVADLAFVWALLEIPEAEAANVRPGARVRVTIDGAPGEVHEGTISRVGESVNPESRSVTARVELANPERKLKAGSFIRASVEIGPPRQALLVPKEAVQFAEDRPVVFVKRESTVFEPVAVALGQSDRATVEVTSGLTAGMEVVTTGAFLLKTEILKESIGAGCCEVGGSR